MYLNNPEWIEQHRYPYDSFDDIPSSVFEVINTKLDRYQNTDPVVSIVIPAWNEEVNILNCISSLSDMNTTIPFEIIVVNNNSSDKTQQTIEKLHVVYLNQKIQGCGPARQLGQENAKGKYILLADADCIYPNLWLDKMLEKLLQKDVVCVYGRYSFIGEEGYERWKLFFLEKLRDVIAELRHYKRPHLNAYGMSMGYIKDLGLKVGFVNYKIRGEDGRLCFDLMQYGKVLQVKSRLARPWTKPRTLQLDGSFSKALYVRIRNEIGRIGVFFTKQAPHDTKTSSNE